MKLEFLDKFSKKTQISNLIKIRPVEAELFRADGRRDLTHLIVAILRTRLEGAIYSDLCPKQGHFKQYV